MANSLLDFVMSLVRDPDAAAHYAADPAQAIAAANLTDVTSADVDHLIPVVAESLSTAMPTANPSGGIGGFGGFGGLGDVLDSAHNVWASGAATAAFDAFDDHLPIQGADVVAAQVPALVNVIQQPSDSAPTIVDHGFGAGLDDVNVAESAPAHDLPTYDDLHVVGDSLADGHHDLATAFEDHLPHPQDPGFDAFT